MISQVASESRQKRPVTEASADGRELLGRSASVRVFSLPELVSMVFASADQATLAACAVVCRAWKESALDELWKHLDSILPLFRLLFDVEALLLSGLGGELEFDCVSSINDADWTKFRPYTQRVRSIDIDSISLSLFHSNRALLPAAAIHHPFETPLLPHVRKVKCIACCPACQLSVLTFVSQSTVELELGLDLELNVSREETAPLLRSLRRLSPNIQELVISATGLSVVRDVEIPLSEWISSLRQLTKLSLPPYCQSTAIVRAAGELPELKEFNITMNSTVARNREGREMEFWPDAFPKLRRLEWNSSLPRAFQLLQQSPQAQGLESLYLDCSSYDTQVDVPTFTRLIGRACPRLRELSLFLFPDPWKQPAEAFNGPLHVDVLDREASRGPLDMDVLYGLAPCQDLVTLRIGHPFPLTLNESDVNWIGTTRKKLECLVLCVDPDLHRAIESWMGTPISTLPLLAKLLLNLNHLGLYFNERDRMRFPGELHPQHQFKNLETLQVGFSTIQS
ncbi:hypothetical protein FRC00_012218, partial [Tulasnella sp. 408]